MEIVEQCANCLKHADLTICLICQHDICVPCAALKLAGSSLKEFKLITCDICQQTTALEDHQISTIEAYVLTNSHKFFSKKSPTTTAQKNNNSPKNENYKCRLPDNFEINWDDLELKSSNDLTFTKLESTSNTLVNCLTKFIDKIEEQIASLTGLKLCVIHYLETYSMIQREGFADKMHFDHSRELQQIKSDLDEIFQDQPPLKLIKITDLIKKKSIQLNDLYSGLHATKHEQKGKLGSTEQTSAKVVLINETFPAEKDTDLDNYNAKGTRSNNKRSNLQDTIMGSSQLISPKINEIQERLRHLKNVQKEIQESSLNSITVSENQKFVNEIIPNNQIKFHPKIANINESIIPKVSTENNKISNSCVNIKFSADNVIKKKNNQNMTNINQNLSTCERTKNIAPCTESSYILTQRLKIISPRSDGFGKLSGPSQGRITSMRESATSGFFNKPTIQYKKEISHWESLKYQRNGFDNIKIKSPKHP